MDPVTIGLGVVSIGSKLIGGLKANDAARDAGRQARDLAREQGEEQIRQKRRSAAVRQGLGKAQIYASNLRGDVSSGSTQKYMRGIDYEDQREIAIANRLKRLNMKAARAGVGNPGASLFASAAGDAIGLAAGAFASADWGGDGGGWGSNGTQSDDFLNQAESDGAFDGSF